MVKLIERKDEVKVTRANIDTILAEQYDKDHEMIEGEFVIHETGKNSFDFRFKKWKKDDYQQYTLENRHRYTLPRMVVRHVNHNIATYSYRDLPNNPGIQGGNVRDNLYSATNANFGHTASKENMQIQVKNYRCQFRATNHDPHDPDLNQPSIHSVSFQY